MRLNNQAKRDINWFTALPTRWNGRAIWRSPQTALLHCDASPTAWGAVLNLRLPARNFWTPSERRHHITWLELRAVHLALQSVAPQLRGRHVLLREDNQAVCSILRTMTSRSPLLMAELRRLCYTLDTLNVTLCPRYIRSADNWWADDLSRLSDFGDWRLRRQVFNQLSRDWGPFTIDRFATALNAQPPRYNSAWLDPGTEGMDAFAQTNWAATTAEHNWCNPPWELLDRLAQHLDETGARAVVVAPLWPAQPWFQRLQALCAEIRYIPASENLFSPGRLLSSASIAPPKWSVACFRILGRQ